MPGSKRLDISVPEEIYEEICQYVYTKKYEHHPKDAIVLNILRTNKDKPLIKIAYILRVQYKIFRRPLVIKRIAQECGIEFTH